MHGTPTIPFSALVRDTIQTHGLAWAAQHYAKRGLPLWQFVIFAGLRQH